VCGGVEVGRRQAGQFVGVQVWVACQAERLSVQSLLEDRARVAGVAEALTALTPPEDPEQLLGGTFDELVLVLPREGGRDRDQLLIRVVRKDQLAGKA
jgi:hypothetical protein